MSKEQIEEFKEDLRYCHVEYIGDYGGVFTDYRETAEKLAILGYRRLPEGVWVKRIGFHTRCSFCNSAVDEFISGYEYEVDYNPPFCPNCGAKMTEVENATN